MDTALARMANAVGLASNTIAARLGLKESSVSRWMTGDRIVTAARLPALARLLKQPQRAVWEASKASLHAKAKRPPYDPVFTDEVLAASSSSSVGQAPPPEGAAADVPDETLYRKLCAELLKLTPEQRIDVLLFVAKKIPIGHDEDTDDRIPGRGPHRRWSSG